MYYQICVRLISDMRCQTYMAHTRRGRYTYVTRHICDVRLQRRHICDTYIRLVIYVILDYSCTYDSTYMWCYTTATPYMWHIYISRHVCDIRLQLRIWLDICVMIDYSYAIYVTLIYVSSHMWYQTTATHMTRHTCDVRLQLRQICDTYMYLVMYVTSDYSYAYDSTYMWCYTTATPYMWLMYTSRHNVTLDYNYAYDSTYMWYQTTAPSYTLHIYTSRHICDIRLQLRIWLDTYVISDYSYAIYATHICISSYMWYEGIVTPTTH